MEKQEFLSYVASVIAQRPDWFGDLIMAVQSGVHVALDNERNEKANMAYSLSLMIEQAPDVAEEESHRMQKGIESLADFFVGANIEQTYRDMLED